MYHNIQYVEQDKLTFMKLILQTSNSNNHVAMPESSDVTTICMAFRNLMIKSGYDSRDVDVHFNNLLYDKTGWADDSTGQLKMHWPSDFDGAHHLTNDG